MTQPRALAGSYIVVANDVGTAAHHGSKMVTARIVDELTSRGFEVVTVPAGQNWRDHTAWIEGAAAVVVNGEGTLHHRAAAAASLLALGPYCQSRSVPAFLVNSVWQDNSTFMAHQAKSFTDRFVRESKSADQLAESGVSAGVVPDLVLGWTPADDRPTDRAGIVVTDSVLLPDTNRLAKLAHDTRGAIFTTLQPPTGHPVDYTEAVFRRLTAEKKLTPAGLIRRLAAKALRVRGEMAATIRRRRGDQHEFSVSDFFSLLRRSELLITGRYHAVCMAMVTGTPFLAPASNSHKIEGMLQDAGLAHRMMGVGGLREALIRPPEWRREDADLVAAYCQGAKEAQRNMFDVIVATARQGGNSPA